MDTITRPPLSETPKQSANCAPSKFDVAMRTLDLQGLQVQSDIVETILEARRVAPSSSYWTELAKLDLFMRDFGLPHNLSAYQSEYARALKTLIELRETLGMAPSIPIMPLAKTRSWPKHQGAPTVAYGILGDALSKSYATDAHFAAYANPGNPYRLTNASAPPRITGGVKMMLFIADVDDAEAHKTDTPSSDDWWEAQQPKILKLLRKHPGAFIYRTRGGYRIVYLLAVPIFIESLEDVERWKARYKYWLTCLHSEFEIVGDRQCSYWSCAFRLPLATREKTGQQPWDVLGDQHEIGIWDVTPSEEELEVAARTPRPAGPPLGVDRCDEIIKMLVPSVSKVVRARHLIYLDLGGALAQRGVTSHEARYIGEEIAKQSGDSSAHDQGRAANDSADRYYAGATLRGFGSLKGYYPESAEALDAVLPEGKRYLREDLAGAHEMPPPTDGNANGLTVQYDPPGAGKTHRAADRLAKTGKGIMAFPTHEVIGEKFAQLSKVGVKVEWRRGVTASVNLNANGGPNCRKYAKAKKISDAGGSVQLELCRYCAHRNGCPALKPVGRRGGVILVPHQLLASACKEHPTLPVVVDETPQILDKDGKLTSAAEVLRDRDNITLLDATPNWIELRALRRDVHAAALFQRAPPPIELQHTVLYAGAIARTAVCKTRIIWPSITNAFKEALRLARKANVQQLLVVTYMKLADELRLGRSPLQGEICSWEAEGKKIDIWWYGNIRGVNTWSHFDGCVTLGDPYPSRNGHEKITTVLGLPDHERWPAYSDRARAELTQSHGRLRDVRRPDDEIWHLHVGKRAPRDWTTADTVILDLPVGRPSVPSEMEPEEVKQIVEGLNGLRQAESILHIPRSTLHRWASGEHPVPRDRIELLRSRGVPQ